ncbi:MAG: YfiR family protein [Burkholderiales bacterium]|nr:YfiR family protein [Burkholderiales bacterium]
MADLKVLLRALARWARAVAWSALAAASVPALAANESADKARETLVKAAFLHKFASFVEWPAEAFARADSPLRIGVMGDDQVWQDLTELARDRDRDGRPVVAVRLKPGDAVTGFHILYVRTSSAAKMLELLPHVPEGVLTVADSDGAHPRGSVMSFFIEDGRVRFGISLESATRQRLRMSARLLAVARNIQGSVGLPALLVQGMLPLLR